MVQNPLILISSGRIMGELSMQRRQSELYGLCIAQSGGVAVLDTGGDCSALAQRCDALLLSGGGDVHPALYGQTCDTSAHLSIDPVRDGEEQGLFEAFAARNKPILGVCRGIQVINVLCGGTLFQHLDDHSDACHPITCSARLAALVGSAPMVNSYHHQACNRLGQGLRLAARAPDGVIEAIWHESLPILGVQWHPERMVPSLCDDVTGENHATLFDWLVQQA